MALVPDGEQSVDALFNDMLNSVAEIADPGTRAILASSLIGKHQVAIADLSNCRRHAIQDLLDSGMTQTEVARLLSMSKPKLSHL